MKLIIRSKKIKFKFNSVLGKLLNGINVPWENEVINTSQENFIWIPNTAKIQIINEGFYLVLNLLIT